MSNYSTISRIKEAIAEKNSPLCLGELPMDYSRQTSMLDVQWIYGLINVAEAASFEFAILDDL